MKDERIEKFSQLSLQEKKQYYSDRAAASDVIFPLMEKFNIKKIEKRETKGYHVEWN